MRQLFTFPLSPFAAKVRIALYEKGLETVVVEHRLALEAETGDLQDSSVR
jgi:glutathione S-transferase